MPIRLNLLAEAQAAEELRRRDPVKRAIIFGALLVAMMLVWSSSLQVRAMLATKDLGKIERQASLRTNEYEVVRSNIKRTTEIKRKLASLHELATNRFLTGSLLNALQQTTTDDVQLMKLKVEQKYELIEGTKAHTNINRTITPAKPPTATERIVLILEAKDSSSLAGDQFNKYKEALAGNPYFQSALGKTNEVRLTNLLPTQNPGDTRPYVSFTLECRFPEKTR